MQQEHTLEEIYHRYGGTGLVVGSQVRQFVVSSEGLALMACSHASRQVVLTAYDVLIDRVDGLDI